MNITQLEYFKTVAECGSFSVAASKLFVSQPTLSISVKKLEEELGLTLFVRNSKGFAYFLNETPWLVESVLCGSQK